MDITPITPDTLIDRKTLRKIVPLSDRTIFNMEKRGEFPHRIALSCRCVAWKLEEIRRWIEERRSSGDKAICPGTKAAPSAYLTEEP